MSVIEIKSYHEINTSVKDKYCIVVFFVPQHGNCHLPALKLKLTKTMTMKFEQLAKCYTPGTFYKVNLLQLPGFTREFIVYDTSLFVVFHNGLVKESLSTSSGELLDELLKRWFKAVRPVCYTYPC